ncbi:MAG: LegC family aminotransferase [Anaerolineales bacterium]|jgi:perosamine synthetase
MSFEPGALPPEGFIPLCVPEIQGNEWKYVKECLDTNWVSSVGSYVDRFENELARYVGVNHAVATCNGTAALHIALLVAGIQADDEVLVSSLTFIAAANSIRYVGAWPVFIDAEPDHWQMDPQKVAVFLEQECERRDGAVYNKRTQRRVRGIMPVHILGHPCDMDPILDAARQHELVVIEDATESLGAEYKGRKIGTLGDIACFSFNGNKIITTGGGGMIVTDNQEWAQRAKYLSTQAKDDPLEYVHAEIGYNYRLTNVQAAMGCAQLESLDDHIAAKRRIAASYKKALEDVQGITPMPQALWAKSIYWMYTVLIDEDQYGLDSRALLRKLKDAGIQTRPLWQPMHRSPAYNKQSPSSFPIADELHERGLSLPSSVGLTNQNQVKVVDAIRDRDFQTGAS